MGISIDDVERIIEDIFVVTLGLDLQPGFVPHRADAPVVTGVVQITGDWQGAVAIRLSQELADHAAATMFALAPDELGPDDVRDTVGEIANMAGGNFKSLLDGSCALSLPAVTEGVRYEVSIPGTVVTQTLDFTCAAQPVTVSIHEQQ